MIALGEKETDEMRKPLAILILSGLLAVTAFSADEKAPSDNKDSGKKEEPADKAKIAVEFLMEMANPPGKWEYAGDKTLFKDSIEKVSEFWKTKWKDVEKEVTPEKVREISRYAKEQMAKYEKVAPFEKMEFTPTLRDKDGKKVIFEATVETLPTHSPLVTRWLKVLIVYDTEKKSVEKVFVTIRGELQE